MRPLRHLLVLLLGLAASSLPAQQAGITNNPGAPILSAEKTAQAREMQAAKMAQIRARGNMSDVMRRLAGLSDPKVERAKALSAQKIQEGELYLQQGNGSAALRLFESAEAFLRRVAQSVPGSATDPCASAQANLARVQDLERRAENTILLLNNSVATELVLRARRLLEEAARQLAANLCKESLRTSRLAENLLKRAAEIALEARR